MKSAGPGRGHFETMEVQGDVWHLSGWICHPDEVATSVAALADGVLIAEAEPTMRVDVAAALPWIAHASASGFCFDVPRSAASQRILVEARRGHRVLASIRTTLAPVFEALEQPPADLMRRVSGSPSAQFFDADGVRSYSEFFDAVANRRDWGSISRMLDWGCGCGRIARCFLRAHPGLEVHGCDIDAEAVAWCAANLPAGRFQAIRPQPPTAYADAFFPLVIGYSVFSHLDADLQRAWLAEMRRIIAPGGLFLASVHGAFAARFSFPQPPPEPSRWPWRRKRPSDLLAAGFIDAGEDVALQGIAPPGYYRGVFQSPAWTRRVWSDYFRVLEIVEGGMQNFQDLVILERR